MRGSIPPRLPCYSVFLPSRTRNALLASPPQTSRAEGGKQRCKCGNPPDHHHHDDEVHKNRRETRRRGHSEANKCEQNSEQSRVIPRSREPSHSTSRTPLLGIADASSAPSFETLFPFSLDFPPASSSVVALLFPAALATFSWLCIHSSHTTSHITKGDPLRVALRQVFAPSRFLAASKAMTI